jgi:hypothetical protein
MGKVLVKTGVEFTRIAPAGARILEVLRALVTELPFNVTITSACDGVHSAGDAGGRQDPHYTGEAYDLRTRDLTALEKGRLLMELQRRLGDRFYAFLEAPLTPNEHIHVQRRKGTVYSILDYLAA